MVTVNGLTKERMLAIEAESIVGGTVVVDHLILTRHDGTTIDAGDVRGPVGDATGSIHAVAADHYLGPNANGGAGERLHIVVTTGTVQLLAEGTDANIDMDISAKGTGVIGLTGQVNASSHLAVLGVHTWLGQYALSSGSNVSRLHIMSASTGMTVSSEGDTANRDLAFMQKGTGKFYFQIPGPTNVVQIDSIGNIIAKGGTHYFGNNAFGGSGPLIQLQADAADPTNVYLMAQGFGPIVSIGLRMKGAGTIMFQNSTPAVVGQIDNVGVLKAIGPTSLFGSSAMGATGRHIQIGEDGVSAAIVAAQGTTANIPLAIRSKGTSPIFLQSGDATTTWMQVQNAAADLDTWLLVRRSVGGLERLDRVSVGAADSGGTGFRVLHVPN